MILTAYLVLLLSCFMEFVYPSTTVSWIGRSGKWSDASHWSTGVVPSASSHVVINISSIEFIQLDVAAVVSQLEMLGGMIELQHNSTLNISANFIFEEGIFSCRHDINDTEKFSHIHVFGRSIFRGDFRKYFRYIYLQQHDGEIKWTDGDLLLYNSSILIHQAANMTIQLPSAISASTLILQSDESRTHFDAYPNQVLNTEANLVYMFPPKGGVLDMTLHRASKISTTRTSRELFPIIVSQDLPSLEFYAQSVTDVGFGYRYSMYNATFTNIDEDECASLCTHEYNWCESFEYSFHNVTCRLSRFVAKQVGGLTRHVDHDNDATNVRYPVRHFQRRSVERNIDSYILSYGPLNINCNDAAGNCASFVSSISISVGSTISVGQNVNASFESNLILLSQSSIILGSNTAISMSGTNSSLFLDSDAMITKTMSMDLTIVLAFYSGYHSLMGTVADGLAIMLLDDAFVNVNNSVNFKSGASTLGASSCRISSGSTLFFWSDTNAILNASQLSVESGWIMGSNISIFSDAVRVSSTGVITATEMGYNISCGPAAGANANLGASGGGHGGRGAAGKVDASGAAYDSTIDRKSVV